MIAPYDSEAVEAMAKKVLWSVYDLERMILDIDSVVHEMAFAWDDPAQKKFEEQWTEMSKKLKMEFLPTIYDYGKMLEKHSEHMIGGVENIGCIFPTND